MQQNPFHSPLNLQHQFQSHPSQPLHYKKHPTYPTHLSHQPHPNQPSNQHAAHGIPFHHPSNLPSVMHPFSHEKEALMKAFVNIDHFSLPITQ